MAEERWKGVKERETKKKESERKMPPPPFQPVSIAIARHQAPESRLKLEPDSAPGRLAWVAPSRTQVGLRLGPPEEHEAGAQLPTL